MKIRYSCICDEPAGLTCSHCGTDLEPESEVVINDRGSVYCSEGCSERDRSHLMSGPSDV